MRSPFGPVAIRNETPVNLTGRWRGNLFGVPMRNDTDAQLAAVGSVGTLFAITSALGTSVSAVEWHLYRRAKSGKEEDRVEVTAHAALDLINKPNPFYTRPDLIETTQQPIDLVGEGIVLLRRMGGPTSLPLELWPVRPDRMEPVPHPTEFISHWLYHSPDGEKIRIENADVGRIKLPNPRDPFRGMGPVQSLLADIDSSRYSAEWNRNFFINGAEPGGIIEVENALSDPEFNEMTSRWREQHQGVGNAHRVAIIEHGKWVDRKMSMKDMQFAEMRDVPREIIREAYRMSKFMLGSVEGTNRATAIAAKAVYAENLIVPRLDRWKRLLNTWLLPMYSGGDKLEFDYDNPVPPDAEALDRERDSKIEAAAKLITQGFEPAGVLVALGLPEIPFMGESSEMSPRALAEMLQKIYLSVGVVIDSEEAREILNRAGANLDPGPMPEPTEPVPPQLEPGQFEPEDPSGEDEDDLEKEPPPFARARVTNRVRRILNAASEDLEAVQAQWDAALTALLASYGAVTTAQRAALLTSIRSLIDDGDLAGLSALSVDSAAGAALLEDAMADLSDKAATQTAREADKQGVKVDPVPGSDFGPAAVAGAALLAAGLAGSAGREALRLATPGVSAADVADGVSEFLESLTDRAERDQLGGALTAAQNQARLATLEAAPDATYVATEALDSATCAECRRIDGTEFATLDDAAALYGNGGYTKCAGRERCRGTIVAEWTTQSESE